MVTESLWQRERTISVQALIAAIFAAGELETERQGRARVVSGEEKERREKAGSGSTARCCSKTEVYWILLILRVSTFTASYPRLKDQGTVKPYKRPTAEASERRSTCRTVECDRSVHESPFELPQQRPSYLKPPIVWSQPKVAHCPARAESGLVEGRSSYISDWNSDRRRTTSVEMVSQTDHIAVEHSHVLDSGKATTSSGRE